MEGTYEAGVAGPDAEGVLTRPTAASLYADVGGTDGLHRLATAFFDRVLTDPLLAPMFDHFSPAHVEHFTIWLAEVLGGPADFTARLGGHQALLRSHLGYDIRDEHRERFLELMADTIAEVLPGRPDRAAALMSYFAWGSRIAQDISQEPVGTDLGTPGPVPRWGYAGLIES